MEVMNFTFTDDHIGLVFNQTYLDLHNCFDFVECSEKGDQVELRWRRTESEWVSSELPASFSMIISEVSYFEEKGIRSHTIEELGFFENDTLGRAEYNPAADSANGRDVLVVRFSSGGEVVAIGKRVCLHEGV